MLEGKHWLPHSHTVTTTLKQCEVVVDIHPKPKAIKRKYEESVFNIDVRYSITKEIKGCIEIEEVDPKGRFIRLINNSKQVINKLIVFFKALKLFRLGHPFAWLGYRP